MKEASKTTNRMMHYQKNVPFFKRGVCTFVIFSALLFISCRGQTHDGSSQLIVAMAGETAVLPCYLETPADASDLVVEWGRPDLNPGFIHVWRNSEENVDFKQPSYTGRTSLFINKLKHGDVSLKISRVRISDEGKYRCLIPSHGQVSVVELVVGSVSTPFIDVISDDSGELVLQCESKGWYPEPEVLWLDSEGNLLSAGPTETVRGPDDLYTVSSTVTVEKRHSNRYSCRVQQRNINQTRETRILIKHYDIKDSTSCTVLIITVAVSVVCTFMCNTYWRALFLANRDLDG